MGLGIGDVVRSIVVVIDAVEMEEMEEVFGSFASWSLSFTGVSRTELVDSDIGRSGRVASFSNVSVGSGRVNLFPTGIVGPEVLIHSQLV